MCVEFCTSTNISATAVSPHSIEVRWDQLSVSSNNPISYTITALNANNGEKKEVNGHTGYILTKLMENTHYIISVQAITSDGRKSPHSNKVLVTTHVAGK